MAKIAGISGDIAGKIGNVVYSVVRGVNIARKYNPQPYNPSTEGQIESRAKLKLISQLSAIVANQLAVVRTIGKTARNVFVSTNYAFLTYVDGVADMVLADMQLTSGFVGFPGFSVERVPNYGMSVELAENAFPAFDKIVWVVYKVLSDGKLMFNESKVLNLSEEAPLGATIMQNVEGDCTIHCYGISTKSAKAVAAFENLAVSTADEVARLVSSRIVGDSDVTLSETRGVYLKASENAAATSGAGMTLSLGFAATSSVQSAALQGAGRYAFGSEVTITAPEVGGNEFIGWYREGSSSALSSDRVYTFTVGTRSYTLYALYRVAQ